MLKGTQWIWLSLVSMVTVGGCRDDSGTADPCREVDCSGHGRCAVTTENTAVCVCDEGYHAQGLECVSDEDPCAGVDCSGHGSCAVQDGQAVCLCDEGYRAQGLECVAETDPCEGVTCSGHGRCEVVGGGATCVCDPGYQPEGLECRPEVVECNDGIDNDGDGLTDWQMDLGCYSAGDPTEGSPEPMAREDGWTVFEPGPDSRLVYVSSSEGDDANDGSSPDQAVRTIERGAELVRDGHYDFLLLKRGDVFRDVALGRFKSGQDADHRLVIASYGDSTERPRIEVTSYFIDHAGRTRSYLALVGVEIHAYRMDPDHPDYDGENYLTGLRLVGGGDDILIEDCMIRFGDIIVQSYEGQVYRNVVLRRSTVTGHYAHGTCPSNAEHRPSGIYAHEVEGLTIEENLFDHNGWNEDVADACATMYNHNLYISESRDVVLRGNLVLRASSMGMKIRSDVTGGFQGLVVQDNFFMEGEIGLDIGGNTQEPHRFVDVQVLDNVFTDIGRSNPTGRDFAWYLVLSDNQNTVARGNLLVRQPNFDNAHAINLEGGTNENVVIEGNYLYGLRRRMINVRAQPGWNGVVIRDNTLLDTDLGPALVSHTGGFDAVTYTGNHYSSSGTPGRWFEVDGAWLSLADWMAISGEQDADTNVPAFPDPDRSLERYCTEVLGIPGDIGAFVEAAMGQSRHHWRTELTASAVNEYFREGFGLSGSQ